MIIIIYILILALGLCLFKPLTCSYSYKRNKNLVFMVVYIVICIVGLMFYFNYNQSDFLSGRENSKTTNRIILDENDNKTYNIQIYKMSEYDGKSKDEIYALRKAVVMANKKFVNKDYSPTESIFNISENSYWWGSKGMICKGPGRYANVGLSKESTYANNPLVLLDLGLNRAVTEMADGSSECPDALPIPTSLTIKPSAKTFTVHYNLSGFINNRSGSHFQHVVDEYRTPVFAFGNINARDFGYAYAYPVEMRNLAFSGSALIGQSDEIMPLGSYWCVGDNCGLPGGCNNICNPSKEFIIQSFPAYVKFKLFKNYQFTSNATPDLWFEIYLD